MQLLEIIQIQTAIYLIMVCIVLGRIDDYLGKENFDDWSRVFLILVAAGISAASPLGFIISYVFYIGHKSLYSKNRVPCKDNTKKISTW